MKRFEVTVRDGQSGEFEDLFTVSADSEEDAIFKADRYGYSIYVYSLSVKELND